MNKRWEIELRVGLFVCIGVGLIMLAVIVLGGQQSLFSKISSYEIHFTSVDGLISGAKVSVAGLNVGTVQNIDMDQKTHDIRVTIGVESKYAELVRQDTMAEIATQGMLGDKYISLNTGTPEQPITPPGSNIPIRASRDLTQFLSKSDQLLVSLTSIAGGVDRLVKSFESGNKSDVFFTGMAASAKNLSQVTDHLSKQLEGSHLKGALQDLHEILQKINTGNGTLGALINDPALYDDAKSLMGGANHSRIVRNLVRKTIRDNEAPAK